MAGAVGLTSIFAWLTRCAHWVLDTLYPRDCLFCGRAVADAGHICQSCLERLPLRRNAACAICGVESELPEGQDFICGECVRRRPSFARAVVVARYAGAIRDLILLLKYRHGLWLRTDLVRLLVAGYLAHLAPAGIHPEAVVPVPMLARKRRARGYNQAAVLAGGVAKALGLPFHPRALRRVRSKVRAQTDLHRQERIRNALATYRIGRAEALRGKVVLLVDDVMTTGATCEACARLLLKAGIRQVYVLVVARPKRA